MGEAVPTLVAFDTSAAHCAAAVVQGDRVLASRVEEMGRGQAERLMPLLDEVMSEASCGWADIDAIGVGVGPGNFTGIRIAVATARGLSMALGVPAIGVTSFEIVREGSAARGRTLLSLPAPRGLAYVQAFEGDMPAGEPRLVDPSDPELGMAPVSNLVLPDLPARLARVALRKLAEGAPQGRPAPLYVRPADAAPSREAPPVILP
jgi:tRNA threonylcarbamoyl adenosine modification protein YeaZ